MPTLRLGRRERICTSGEEPLGLSQGAALGLSAQDAGVVLDKPKPEPNREPGVEQHTPGFLFGVTHRRLSMGCGAGKKMPAVGGGGRGWSEEANPAAILALDLRHRPPWASSERQVRLIDALAVAQPGAGRASRGIRQRAALGFLELAL